MRLQRWQWLAIFLFVAAVFVRLIPGPRTIDDAFITFRYARNLLTGNGFAFNAGEHVLGTTTPLFTLILAGIGFFSGGVNAPFPIIALGLSALADGLSCVLLVVIGRRLNAEWAGAAAALAWAIAPFSVTFAVGGLETSFYVFLLLAIFWTTLEQRFEMAALLSAAALLTRPDALLLVVPLAIDRLFFALRRGAPKITAREATWFFLPLAIWAIFATVTFGSPIPQSVLAKATAYKLGSLDGLVRLLQHYATPFLEHLTFGTSWIKVGLVLYPFLAIVGTRAVLKRAPAAWPFALFPFLYFVVFAIANPLTFRWYLTTPLPFYFLVILIGLEVFQLDLIKGIKRKFHPHPLIASFLYVLPVVLFITPTALQLRGWTPHPTQPPDRPAPEMAWIELELLYKEAAEKLAADQLAPLLAAAPQPVTLAAGDVGVLGYYTNARILDLVGINSAETLNYYPLNEKFYGDFIYAVSPDEILEQRPDYVVILEIYGRYGLLKDQRFQAAYQLIETIPTDIYGSDGLLIFALKE